MKLNIQSVNFNIKEALTQFIQKKFDKLDRYFDKVIDADIYLKLDNTSEKENKIIEAKLKVPGDALVVKKHGKTFEEATDLAIGSLERQLKKHKEKTKAH